MMATSSSTSRKRVNFNKRSTGVKILSIYDYTPSEMSAAWYDEEEMERITKRCMKVLKKMESGKGKKYFTRGLKGHTISGCMSKKLNRFAAIQAVLMEQAYQQADDQREDAQAIADAYQRICSSYQMWAQVVGKRDQAAADAAGVNDEGTIETTAELDSLRLHSTILQNNTKPIQCKKALMSHLDNMIFHQTNARAA